LSSAKLPNFEEDDLINLNEKNDDDINSSRTFLPPYSPHSTNSFTGSTKNQLNSTPIIIKDNGKKNDAKRKNDANKLIDKLANMYENTLKARVLTSNLSDNCSNDNKTNTDILKSVLELKEESKSLFNCVERNLNYANDSNGRYLMTLKDNLDKLAFDLLLLEQSKLELQQVILKYLSKLPAFN
jgi:hypothetical protein